MTAALAALSLLAAAFAAQHGPAQPGQKHQPAPLPAREGPLRKAQSMLREGKTEEARPLVPPAGQAPPARV